MAKTIIPESYEALLRGLVLTRLRIVGIAGMALMLMFSRLDAVVYPAHWFDFLLIRLAVAVFFIFVIALSFHKSARRHVFLLCDAMVFAAAFGIALMVYLSEGSTSDYYEGLNLTFLALFAMNSFRPKHHVLTGAAIIACYVAAALGGPWPVVPAKFVSALFFMVSTLIFVALTAKFFGRQHLDQFLKSEEIDAKNKQIEEAYQRLRQSEKLKDEFFANVSHELRTPLTLILGPLESLLPDSGKIDSAARGLLSTLYRNALRLLQMINGLLDFSKLEAGKMEVKRQPLEIVSATEAVLEDFRPAVEQKGLSFSFRPEQPEAFVQMDRYLYDRILFNLISNAVKFTEKGGITVRLAAAGSEMTLTVQDTGIGIPQDQLPCLFEKFHQIEGSSTRRFEGTGLGLALVKEFVTLLEGTITVASRPGEGSCFTAALSAPPAGEQEARKASVQEERFQKLLLPAKSPAEEAETLSEAKAGKILVAEDNQELAAYIGLLLKPLMEVRYAKNGKQALETALEWLPDLILSDIMMPEMDGLDLCREVKKDERIRHIPVVLLTALTHREALLQGWDVGADEYLFKPFHPTELVTRIKSLMNSVFIRRDIEGRLIRQTEETTRLRTELEQLELFSFIASHDLQEPLHTILTLSSYLQQARPGAETSEQADCLRQIDESARQMRQYVMDVLKYARVGAAETQGFQRVDLNEVFARVLEIFQKQIAEAGVRIEKDYLPSVQSDPVQMEQLLKNLVGNAIKFRRPEIVPEIRIRYTEEENAHFFVFEDNGIGFDEKYAAEIFKPFYRLQKQKIKGSGIGLAICQKIVQRHGGKITVHSAPGKGASFEIRLPKETAPAAAASASPAFK